MLEIAHCFVAHIQISYAFRAVLGCRDSNCAFYMGAFTICICTYVGFNELVPRVSVSVCSEIMYDHPICTRAIIELAKAAPSSRIVVVVVAVSRLIWIEKMGFFEQWKISPQPQLSSQPQFKERKTKKKSSNCRSIFDRFHSNGNDKLKSFQHAGSKTELSWVSFRKRFVLCAWFDGEQRDHVNTDDHRLSSKRCKNQNKAKKSRSCNLTATTMELSHTPASSLLWVFCLSFSAKLNDLFVH